MEHIITIIIIIIRRIDRPSTGRRHRRGATFAFGDDNAVRCASQWRQRRRRRRRRHRCLRRSEGKRGGVAKAPLFNCGLYYTIIIYIYILGGELGRRAHETWACSSIGRQDHGEVRPLVAGRRRSRRRLRWRPAAASSAYSRSTRDPQLQSTRIVHFGVIVAAARSRAKIFVLFIHLLFLTIKVCYLPVLCY